MATISVRFCAKKKIRPARLSVRRFALCRNCFVDFNYLYCDVRIKCTLPRHCLLKNCVTIVAVDSHDLSDQLLVD
jgi:hypothetical protein